MNVHLSAIRDANDFRQAQLIITDWLGAGKVKPGAQHFEEIAGAMPRWISASQSVGDNLEGVALIGRLWSLASWRAVPRVADWTRDTTRSIIKALGSDDVERFAEWGGADERRFVSNALEVADLDDAREIGIALLLTESARKSTKATSHHLECLRRQGLTMEALAQRAPSVWRRIARQSTESNNAPIFMFENFVAALAGSRWQDGEVGNPDFTSLVEAMAVRRRIT